MTAKVEITHPQEKRKAIPPSNELLGGIALFFIETEESEALSAYPLEIYDTGIDISSLLTDGTKTMEEQQVKREGGNHRFHKGQQDGRRFSFQCQCE